MSVNRRFTKIGQVRCMNMLRPPRSSSARIGWIRSFAPNPRKLRRRGAPQDSLDVEREVGRDALELAVRRRGFHMIECGPLIS
jgi:hypothetical protein